MADVYVLGDINADITTTLQGYPAEGDDSEIGALAWCSGGAAANTATALALLGGRVLLLGRVGGDPAAAVALRAAGAAGVDLALVQQDEEVATGVCIAAISPGGQRTFLSFRGANVQLDGSGWTVATFAGARALHICAHSLLEGPQQQASLRALALARTLGMAVSLDLAPPTIRRQRHLLDELLPEVGMLFLNEAELLLLYPGLQIDSALAQVIADGVALVALKRGAQGCTVATACEQLDLAAIPMEAHDTNGCGDAFAAGFLWAHLAGAALLGCAAMGNLLGGVTATGIGAADALPRQGALRAALTQQGNDWVGRAVIESLLSLEEL